MHLLVIIILEEEIVVKMTVPLWHVLLHQLELFFVPGFRSTDKCPFQVCPSLPPNGYTYSVAGSTEKSRCRFIPCPVEVGWWYRRYAENQAQCTMVRDRCNNAKHGEKYILPKSGQVISDGECPVVKCPDAEIGYYLSLSKPGTCHYVQCNNAQAGEYYKSGAKGTNQSCAVGACMNARKGEVYISGWSISPFQCKTNDCFRPPGYTFEEHGNCWKLKRCPNPQPGFYHTRGGVNCSMALCQARGNWRYVSGFSTRPDKCPYIECN